MKKSPRRLRLAREFTAVVQKDAKWFIAFCPEVPGANGQGRARASCLKSLAEAIKLLLEIQEDELAGLCGENISRARFAGTCLFQSR
jgi:predicted RNase H-like HicB family nuclease